MAYRAKEVKKMIEADHQMRHNKIRIYKAIGAARFFWLDNHIEVEEKLWHPVIILKYFLFLIISLTIFAFIGTPIGCDFFRSEDHPTAVRLTSEKEIKEAIENDKAFYKKELEQHSWV